MIRRMATVCGMPRRLDRAMWSRGNNFGNHVAQSSQFHRGLGGACLRAGARRRLGLGRDRRGDHRRGRGRHRRGAAKSRRPGGASCCSRRATASAGAASPRPAPSAFPTIAARTGCTCRTSIRWASSRRAGSRFIRRRRAEAAHRQAQRARRRDGGLSSPRSCARTAPSGCRARQGRRRLHAGAAEGSRRLASGGRIRARAVRLRQESRRDLGDGFRALAGARRRSVLPSGLGALLAKARRRRLAVQLKAPVTRMQCDARLRRDGTPDAAASRRAPRIVTVSTGVLAAGKIRFAPELPPRQLDADREALARHLRARRAGAEGQSAAACSNDDLVFEKASGPQHRRAARQCRPARRSAMVEIAGKIRRELAADGEAAMTDFATGLARRALRRRCQEGGRQARMRRAGTRIRWVLGGFLGRGAGRPAGAPRADGAGARPAVLSPAKRCTRRCGARSAAPGSPASARRKRRCGKRAC